MDDYYVEKVNRDPGDLLGSSSCMRFAEDILTSYFDLDLLIEDCGLSEREREIVNGLMEGWHMSELAEKFEYAGVSAVKKAFHEAVMKIVSRHNERWLRSMELEHRYHCKRVNELRRARQGIKHFDVQIGIK